MVPQTLVFPGGSHLEPIHGGEKGLCFRFHQQPPDSDGALGEGDLKRYFDDLVDDVDAWRLRFGKSCF
jgi:hypothetical protein